MGIGGPYHDRENPCVRFTIDYVDYVVARTFLSTVDEWERSLDRTKLLKLPEWFEDNEWHMEKGFTAVGTAASIWGAASLLADAGGDILVRGGLVGIVAVLAAFFFEFVFDAARSHLSVHQYFPYILMNKGDDRNYDKFIARRTFASKVGFAIFSSGILVMVANVFAKYISKKLGLT